MHVGAEVEGVLGVNYITVVQSFCIAERKLGAGRGNRCHCRSGYLPETLEGDKKKTSLPALVSFFLL